MPFPGEIRQGRDVLQQIPRADAQRQLCHQAQGVPRLRQPACQQPHAPQHHQAYRLVFRLQRLRAALRGQRHHEASIHLVALRRGRESGQRPLDRPGLLRYLPGVYGPQRPLDLDARAVGQEWQDQLGLQRG